MELRGVSPLPREQRRRHSAPATGAAKVYNFEDVKALVENPDEDRVLIGTFPAPSFRFHRR